MEWREEGLVLARRRHGEHAAIIEVFTENHGRHAGIVRGGMSRKVSPILEPGNQVDATWRARLSDHLGSYTVEPVTARAATLMADRTTLAGLNAITALLSFALPEREAHPALYHRTLALFDMMGSSPYWPLAYIRWELSLLEELGFGLDLGRCAVTDRSDNLVYVSPKSGRAVSSNGAGDYADRMLALSPALIGEGDGTVDDIRDALTVTGHFLSTWLATSLGNKDIPKARDRLVQRLGRP